MSEAEKRRKDREELHELFHAIEPTKNEDIARRAISIADYWLIKAENQAKHIQDLEARNSKQPTIEPERKSGENPDHGYMWICPECGLEVHSDFEKCVRCGYDRERKKGKWLDGHRAGYGETLYWYIYCSECLYERDDDDHDKDTPFCPNCGCAMTEEGDQE